MGLPSLTWFAFGAFLVYVVAVDENVYDFLVLLSKRLTQLVQIQWFKFRYHPDSPWVRYEVERNAKKMAEDLIKEYENK